MSASSSNPRVFTIPPGVPFLGCLAEALLDNRLLPEPLHDPADPASLANTTIYVPTRRSARALRSEIALAIGRPSAILPVIRPLGETDDDSGFFDETDPVTLDLDPPVTQVPATLLLADLVLAWKQALPQAVTDHLRGLPLIAPANPADAVWLGRSLFDLIQSVEIEEADFTGLDNLIEENLQQWWQITAEFLRIARQFWPHALAERRLSSPARHHNALIDAETRRMVAGKYPGPVIVAGSTGTRPSTARLIAAVSRLERGAVVLPGLDGGMRPSHWQMIEAMSRPPERGVAVQGGRQGASTIRSHPQYGLLRLLSFLGLDAGAVSAIPTLAEPAAVLGARNRVVSAALLPPEATSDWSDPALLPGKAAMLEAMSGVSLIEAANEREEAAALAAAMRKALEPAGDRPQPVAALVTPDRNLARRVVVELARYGIAANDSGGVLLNRTDQGSLARLAVQAAFAPGDPVALISLVKHPLARFGRTAEAAIKLGGLVERLALRGGAGEADVENLPGLMAARADLRSDPRAPRWLARITESEFADASAHAQRITEALSPLTSLFLHDSAISSQAANPGPGFPLARLAAATAEALERIAVDENGMLGGLWGGDAGVALSKILLETRDSGAAMALTGHEWIAALDALLSGHMIKPSAGGHPRALVWGTLEARLQNVDVLLLAGLNEDTWPAAGSEDPFLSRAMKSAMGLEPPERRIGQAAHDFQMAMGAPVLVLSRAERVGRSPTVSSRWLQRLLAVAGKEAAGEMRARGDGVLAHVRARDLVPPVPFAQRPEPRPDPAFHPVKYSFSEVGRFRRDPYSIYARRILGLDPLEPFLTDPGPRERGTLYHAILEEFVNGAASGDLIAPRLMRIAGGHFDKAAIPEHLREVWLHRLGQVAQHFQDWEEQRAGETVRRLTECRGQARISGDVSVSGVADRIDILRDGTAVLIDYKTGTTPSRAIAWSLIDPQLALEAFTLMQGGFAGVGAMAVSELIYVRLTGKEKLAERVDGKRGIRKDDPTRSPEELATLAARELAALVAELRSGRRGFMSRVIPESARNMSGDYDHLARVAEWQTAIDDDSGASDD